MGSPAKSDVRGPLGPGSAVRRRSWGAVGWQALVPVLLAAGAGLLVLVAHFHRPPAGEIPTVEAVSVNVEVESVRVIPRLADEFELPAVVEPNRVVHVSAEVEGRVERIACQEGRGCRAGDLLVRLNTDLLEAELAEAEADARYDASRYERISNLFEEGAATKEELDQAAGTMGKSTALLELAKARLERAGIFAPISGVLNQVAVEEGEYVKSGDLVAEIVDVDTAKAVVNVPEKDIRFLTTGAEAKVFVRGEADEEPISGTVSYMNELADRQTRATRLEISTDNRQRLLRSGEIVRVRLTRRVLTDVIMIPLAAVVPLEDGKAVYVAAEGQAERRDVEIGFIKGQRIQVLSGLAAGDRLIVAGHRFVGPGQSVTVVAER